MRTIVLALALFALAGCGKQYDECLRRNGELNARMSNSTERPFNLWCAIEFVLPGDEYWLAQFALDHARYK
jgi:hypothetical protein